MKIRYVPVLSPTGSSLTDAKWYKIISHDDNYGYVFYVRQLCYKIIPDQYEVHLYLGAEYNTLLLRAQEILESGLFTKSSIDFAFRRYPHVKKILRWQEMFTQNFKGAIELNCDGILSKTYNFWTGPFLPFHFFEKTQDLFMLAGAILDELKDGLVINTHELQQNEFLVKAAGTVSNTWKQTPPWLKKALVVGGVFAIRLAVKSIASNIDIGGGDGDFDLDIDTDGDGIPDTSYDSATLIAGSSPAFMLSDSTQGPDGSDAICLPDSGGYSPSFKSQHATLTSLGGVELDATIDKEPGTANHFSIKTIKGTVHNVAGGTNTVTINGIKYKLPKLIG